MYLCSGSILSKASMDFSYLQLSVRVLKGAGLAESKDIHRENDTSAHDQSCKAWNGSRPKCQDTLISKYSSCTCKAVPIFLPSLNRLHALRS